MLQLITTASNLEIEFKKEEGSARGPFFYGQDDRYADGGRMPRSRPSEGMLMKWCLLFLLFTFTAMAQDTTETKTETKPETKSETKTETPPVIKNIEKAAEEIKDQVRNTDFHREHSHHTFMGGYEFLSTWLPFKLTAGYTYIFNKEWSLEAEVGRGAFGTGVFGIDLASVTEYRYSLLARRYKGNSFNTIFGIYKDNFRGKLGSDMLDDMTDTSIDDFRVEVVGVTVGLGNRWQWGNGFTLGVDWIRMNAPIFGSKIDDDVLDNIENDSDRDTIKSGIDKVSKVPTFVLLGLYLGYTF